jgi:hypothetical protein
MNGATTTTAAQIKNVKVKFLPCEKGQEHSHNGQVCKPGTMTELPEDLAEFVINAGKAELAESE